MNQRIIEMNAKGIWEHFTVIEGLPDMKIECICEDSRGVLWIGTHDKGVVAFKEGVFRAFTVRDGLSGNGVYSIVEDDFGRLWFGTDRGLCYYFDGGFEVCKIEGNPSFLWAAIKDSKGGLWFGLKGERGSNLFVCNIVDLSVQMMTFSDDKNENSGINGIVESNDGSIWCCGSGLLKIEGNDINFVKKSEGMKVSTIAQSESDLIWMSTSSGLYQYDEKNDNLVLYEDGLSGTNSVVSMSRDKSNDLWFITEDGRLYRCEDDSLKEMARSGNRFWHGASFDMVGRLWIGSYGMGLFCYDLERFLIYESEIHSSANRVNCLGLKGMGGIWIGIDGGVISHEDGKFEMISGEVEVTAVESAADGTLWIGDRGGGIYRYFNGQIYDAKSVLQSYGLRVKDIVEDKIGRIWFTSLHGRGFGFYENNEVTYFDAKENTTYPSWIGGIAADKYGRIWFGSASPANWDGLCYYEDGVFRRLDNISEYSILSLLVDENERLWVGTNEGVICYSDNDIKIINQENGLSYDIITAISEGSDKTIWFGTEGGGVCCFDGSVIQVVQIPVGGDYNVINDIIEDENGIIWFATQGGLVRYERRCIKPYVYVVKIIADEEYDNPNEIQFTIGVGNVSFRFHGWSPYELSKYLVYRYKLEGVDLDWRQTRDTSVNYIQLRPGEYRFVLQAIDRDLNYSDEAVIELIITEDLRVEGLNEALRSASGRGEFIGESPTIRQVKRQVQEVAWSDLTVLVLGETGTGKGLAVRAIHEMSERRERAFIHVNCGSVQKELFDSELFGHERGAFTGAITRKLGKFELAERGTIFLDEIGDLPLESQTRLLHVLQEKNIERVGGTQPIDVDVRVIAATNRNLIEAVREGLFRADLYYRLNVFPIEIPPLRERIEDVGLLAKYFVRHFAAHLHQQQPFIHEKSLQLLKRYNWPGNVRELEHILQRAVILAGTGAIMPEHLAISQSVQEDLHGAELIDEIVPLNEFERRYLVKVLEKTKGVIQGENGAAVLLGIKPTTLRSKLDRLGVKYRKMRPF
jgi:DNA-binding NtrC family response regulator/ligand-binding sensor domain-containing protein